jgi:hypothetical protein
LRPYLFVPFKNTFSFVAAYDFQSYCGGIYPPSLFTHIIYIYIEEDEVGGTCGTNGEKRKNVYRLLVGKPEGKRPLGRPRRRWIGNIKIDL